jgi:hypothetical protein
VIELLEVYASARIGKRGLMKIILEIPDPILRRAKSRAAKQGISLRQFVTEAVEARLQGTSAKEPRPWMKHFGKLKGLREETGRINKIIEDDLGRIDGEKRRARRAAPLRPGC